MSGYRARGARLMLAAVAVVCAAPAAASESEDKAATASAFIRCDGRVGHVSGGTRFARLLLLTATAGLSEAAMSSDDDSKRAKGAAGVSACNEAIARETDLYRRGQLGLARALHQGEDGKWNEAAAAAHAVPQLASSGGRDWALDRTVATAAGNLEAWALIQQGKLAEAEAVQAAAALRAGPDALALERVAPYMRLTTGMSETKRRAYWHLYRYFPQMQADIIHGFADARRYDDARAALAGQGAIYRAFSDKPERFAGRYSLDAALAAMAGHTEEAKTLLEKARVAFDAERAAGTLSNGGSVVDEQIAFATVAIAAAEGRMPEARKLFGQRSLWGEIAAGMLGDLITRLAAEASPAEKTGMLAEDPARSFREFTARRVNLLKEDTVRKRQWSTLLHLVVDEHYRPMARQAHSGSSSKPKWLIKPGKEDATRFDLLISNFSGPAVNEPLVLHAALIAQARGKKGFVLLPVRKRLDVLGVRFVNAGEVGIIDQSIVDANETIAQLSPHISLQTQ